MLSHKKTVNINFGLNQKILKKNFNFKLTVSKPFSLFVLTCTCKNIILVNATELITHISIKRAETRFKSFYFKTRQSLKKHF